MPAVLDKAETKVEFIRRIVEELKPHFKLPCEIEAPSEARYERYIHFTLDGVPLYFATPWQDANKSYELRVSHIDFEHRGKRQSSTKVCQKLFGIGRDAYKAGPQYAKRLVRLAAKIEAALPAVKAKIAVAEEEFRKSVDSELAGMQYLEECLAPLFNRRIDRNDTIYLSDPKYIRGHLDISYNKHCATVRIEYGQFTPAELVELLSPREEIVEEPPEQDSKAEDGWGEPYGDQVNWYE